MENALMDNRKSLRCIEWTVQEPSSNKTVVSETFLCQNKNCNLNFFTGSTSGRSTNYPYLSFNCIADLLLTAVPITLRVDMNLETLYHQTTTITSTNQNQIIWQYTSLENRRLKFQIIFHVDYSNDDKSVQTPSYLDNRFLMDAVSRDFSKMLSESPCRDVEFICGDQSIKAHKSVLSCRSDVFASMLQSDMVEGKTGRVTIQDMDANLFRQFLQCLYTGVLPTLTVDTAQQFYEAGDKYNISSLKKQCADFLVENLSENAYDILMLADRHNDQEFKKNVIDFMVKEQIPYSDEKWTEFSQSHPSLAIEVLNLFFQHLRPK